MFFAMLAVFLGFLCVYMLEKAYLKRCRNSFKAIIHVNGIRGKTTTCRMLDAVLRQRYAVLTKTTGSDPRIVHVDGRDLPLRRLGPASISEQIRTLRCAARERAEIVILECMAVKPELQRISEEEIVCADIAAITNVRYDHILEMGESLEDIAVSLMGTIPQNGTLYVGDPDFFPLFQERCLQKGSRAILCRGRGPGGENEAITRAIARSLGLDDSLIEEGLRNVAPDAGMRLLYHTRNAKGEPIDFLNLFAANDPQSALMQVERFAPEYAQIRFVYNHRPDRPDRVLLFARHFFPAFPGARVTVIGEAKPLARRLISRAGALQVDTAPRFGDCLDVPAGGLVVGLGNIKGEAKRCLDRLAEEAPI